MLSQMGVLLEHLEELETEMEWGMDGRERLHLLMLNKWHFISYYSRTRDETCWRILLHCPRRVQLLAGRG